DSDFVRFECDWALWRTSGATDFRMILVLLDDPEAHVPHWYRETIDATTQSTRAPGALTARLVKILGDNPNARASRAVRACRPLAQVSDVGRLREKLHSSGDEAVTTEAAILLTCLDDNIDSPLLSEILRQLGRCLESVEAERALFALGKLQMKATPA